MKKIIIIILGIMVAIVGFFMLPWIAIGLGIFFSPAPPMPEITYEEFPFRLVYELNGEPIVVEDAIICEYDGIGMDEGQGKRRKWKSRLASGNDRVVLLTIDDTRSVCYSTGAEASYYMGDWSGVTQDGNNRIQPSYMRYESGESAHTTIIPSPELFDKYGIEIISWEPSPPIVNNFN